MLGGVFGALCCAAETAKDKTTRAVELAGEHASAAKLQASEYSIKQLKEGLEGTRSQTSTAPDVWVTILQVNMQDGVEVKDLFNFRLSGLKCRVRLELVGTAAQLAGMVAAGAAQKVLDKASALPGGLGLPGALGQGLTKAAEGVSTFKENLAGQAAGGTEIKQVEFDLNLDLGVRKAGEEVDAACTIVHGALQAVDKVIPVSRATRYVEECIKDKVKEIVTTWAKNKAKSKAKDVLGEQGYGYAKTGVKATKGAATYAQGAAASAKGAAAAAYAQYKDKKASEVQAEAEAAVEQAEEELRAEAGAPAQSRAAA